MAQKGKLNILIIVVAVIAVLVLAKDIFIKIGVETAVKSVTGLPLKIDSLHLGISSSLIDIKGLKVYNPAGFEKEPMVNIPTIFVDYRLGSILKGKIEVNDMKLHLSEFVIVKNSKGEVNLDYLKTLQKPAAAKEGAPAQKAPAKDMEMQIDNLALKVDKVIYKDYSKGGEPSVKEFKIGIDQTYKDIKNLNAVISIIVVRSLAQTTIANLAGLDLTGVTGAVSDTLKGATDTTKKVLDSTSDTLKGTTENLKGLIKNPFGSKE